MLSTTLSHQIITISLRLRGISVPSTQGILAEKKSISEMLTTAITNFNKGVPVLAIRMDGKNISGKETAAALTGQHRLLYPHKFK